MYYVYILASRRNGTLYVGVTNDLLRRVYEHKSDLVDGFTKRYGVHLLVYHENTGDVASAIQTGKADQEVEPCVEDQNDRAHESRLERPLQRNLLIID
jgi:predicted GIY-YIG superfamily endonuclease